MLNIMAAGRPVVATAPPQSGLALVIGRAGCGLVVPPEAPAALAKAVEELILNPDRRASMGLSGRHFVENYLSRKVVLGALQSTLSRLVLAARGVELSDHRAGSGGGVSPRAAT